MNIILTSRSSGKLPKRTRSVVDDRDNLIAAQEEKLRNSLTQIREAEGGEYRFQVDSEEDKLRAKN